MPIRPFDMKRISICILFLACVLNIQAKNYVVCIGIADYPGTSSDLNLSASAAITMKELYEKNGNAEVVVYTNEQAKISIIKNAINELFSKASATDAITFFFSGHGVPGCFICFDGVLKYKELTSIMSKSLANTKMVFADACFAGKARQGDSVDDRGNKADNVLFFLSSRSDETSAERKFGWKNSLFTGYLERGLRGGADINKDRTITARELFLFVSKGVAEQSRQKQHPVMWGKFDDNMPIMSWKKKK